MQRIPVFAGHITPEQLNGLPVIAIKFTNSTALHLTTRQDIELHNVPQSHLQSILDQLKAIGFLTYGAGGDNVRNITACPCCQFNAAAFDVGSLAKLLKVHLQDHPIRQDMPRKFKISFAGCKRPQSRPYVNDLSFIATSATTVRVIGAGSLGARPETGIVLYEELATEDCLSLTLAAIELFKDHGDRQNRRKARLRHGPKSNCPTGKRDFRKSRRFKQSPGILTRITHKNWHRQFKQPMRISVSIFITVLIFTLPNHVPCPMNCGPSWIYRRLLPVRAIPPAPMA